MSKYTIKPITDKSWILSSNGDKVAIISQRTNGLSVLGNLPRKEYTSIDELVSHLGGNVDFEKPSEPDIEKEAAEVNGYPIKHDVWYDEKHDTVSSYTRTKSSETRYAAGYFSLKFANGWSPSFCPKLSTLVDYEYIGPFKSKLEMQNSIRQKNSSSNV